jgi:hypothetical protein
MQARDGHGAIVIEIAAVCQEPLLTAVRSGTVRRWR